jgi:hypothetical protein
MTSSTAQASQPEENFLGRLDHALDLFSELDSTHLYLNHVRLFVAVCRGADTYREIEQFTGISPCSVSRLARALADTNRKGGGGFGLLQVSIHPTQRGALVTLTKAGHDLKRKLLKA